MTANGRGRKLKPRTDTERLELLITLIGFGRSRGWVCLDWGEEGKGPLSIAAGPVESTAPNIAEDEDGDLRALLDRAISKNAGAKKRAKATKGRRRS